jgi:hypothetical protein
MLMKEIKLTQNKTAIVDDDDYKRLSKYKWRALQAYSGLWYAVRSEGKKNFYMHRDILNPKKGKMVDHINHNGLDNRKENIRICTSMQNTHNARLKPNTTGYRGVHYAYTKKNGQVRYYATLTNNRIIYYLGIFDSPEEASNAYNEKALELREEYFFNYR